MAQSRRTYHLLLLGFCLAASAAGAAGPRTWQERVTDERAKYAAANSAYLTCQRDPTLENQIALVRAAATAGRFDIARAAAKSLAERRDQWGQAAGAAQAACESVENLTYEFVWTLRNPGSGGRTVVIPQQDAHVQTAVTCDVKGAREWEYRQTVEGIRYVWLVPLGNADVQVIATVKMQHFSWWPFLEGAATEEEPPAELAPLLGKTGERGRTYVDPFSAAAREIVTPLLADTRLETIHNILQWVDLNIPWGACGEVWGVMNSEETLRARAASCSPITLATVALLRRAGIPARGIRGQSGISPQNTHPGPHTIPQFYVSGLGWVDSNFGDDTHYLRMYYRYGQDLSLHDVVDPTKDCVMRVIGRDFDEPQYK